MASQAAGDGQSPQIKVFISYSRKDIAFADRLDAALRERGFDSLIDRSDIYAFEDWWARIQSLISEADTIIFVLSPESVASPICAKEVAFAASLNKRFAPVIAQRVDDWLVPEALSRLNFIFFDEEAKFAESFERLCEALRTNIDWIRKHTEYGEAARRWEAEGKPGSRLLRSPALEEAERWIASRPPGAPLPTEATLAFVTGSRRGASRRRNILTGSLAAGFVLALGLAGYAFWEQQLAQKTLTLATQTANGLVYNLAQKFHDTVGVPAATIEDILDRALTLQGQLLQSGQSSPDLLRSEASALDESAKTLLAIGETQNALANAEKARGIIEPLVKQQPDNTLNRDSLATIDDDIGDAQMAQGNLAEALTSYQKSLKIRDDLAKPDPGNLYLQSALAVSHIKIGAVRIAQGNLAEALKSYQAAQGIMLAVTKSAPTNTDWQRELEVIDQKVGLVLAAQGTLPEALKSYQAGLDIMQGLAKAHPDNGQWQEDIGVDDEMIGDVEMAEGDPAAALASYKAKRDIALRLAGSDQGNSAWKRDLAVADEKMGDAQQALKNLDDALQSYQSFLATMEQLTQIDPSNTGWWEDRSIANERVGMLHFLQDNLAEALKSNQAALGIMQRLADSDPGNAQWQRELATSHEKVGDVLLVQNDFSGALTSFQAMFKIVKGLAKPNDAGSQRNLAVAYRDLGWTYVSMKNWALAQQELSAGRAISAALAAQYPDEALWKKDVALFDQLFAELKSEQAKEQATPGTP